MFLYSYYSTIIFPMMRDSWNKKSPVTNKESIQYGWRASVNLAGGKKHLKMDFKVPIKKYDLRQLI